MGTTYTLKLADVPNGVSLDELFARVESVLETVNDQMSTWRDDSEISRFNTYSGTDWFDVSEETAYVAKKSLEFSELSGGAFDITVGPLVDVWGFGKQGQDFRIPSDEDIAAAKEYVGANRIEVRDDPPALRKTDGRTQINLSAIAKGHGVDRVAEVLEQAGVTSYMVEIGGEIRTGKKKGNGEAWTIGIEPPNSGPRGQVFKKVSFVNRSLATSGDYRNVFTKDGKRYSHTIDPRSGRPVEHSLASVSVIADTCAEADALATALMVLGTEEGYNLAAEHHWPVLFIRRTAAGFEERSTPEFETFVAN